MSRGLQFFPPASHPQLGSALVEKPTVNKLRSTQRLSLGV